MDFSSKIPTQDHRNTDRKNRQVLRTECFYPSRNLGKDIFQRGRLNGPTWPFGAAAWSQCIFQQSGGPSL